MCRHQKFLLTVILVSGLLIKQCKAALIEMKRGFPTGRRLVMAGGHLLLWAKGSLVSECLWRSRGHPVVPPDLAFPRSADGGRSHTAHSIFEPSRCEWQALIWCKLDTGWVGWGQLAIFFNHGKCTRVTLPVLFSSFVGFSVHFFLWHLSVT